MSKKKLTINIILILFLVTISFRFLVSYLLPIFPDEAYYLYWNKFLDFGYFDHPPLVSWIGITQEISRDPLWARLGSNLIAALCFPISILLFKEVGLKKRTDLTKALLILHFSLCGLVFGFLITPDVPFLFTWLLSLHEAVVALKRDPKRWITAGIATGIGIWAKYMTLMLGPIFLWALIKKKGALRTPWPWLGACACLVTIAPHLAWNQQNSWVSFKFQMGHGLSGHHNAVSLYTPDLPTPTQKLSQTEKDYGDYFITQIKKPSSTPKKLSNVEKTIQRTKNYLSGQAGLLGFFIFPLMWTLGATILSKIDRKKSANSQNIITSTIDPNTKPLIWAATIFPLTLFGLIALKQNVEVNWPSIYLVTGSIIIVGYLNISKKWMQIAATLNLLVIGLIVLHSWQPIFDIKPNRDRILIETHGWEQLSEKIKETKKPIFADTYQNASMLNYYQPHLNVAQLPGLTRVSELIRRKKMWTWNMKDIEQSSGFILISYNQYPPHMEGFHILNHTELRDCPHERIEITTVDFSRSFSPRCKTPVHRWFKTEYHIGSQNKKMLLLD